MSCTVLGLEILLQERCIDLQAVTDLIMTDVGAVIQTLRMARKECGRGADYPERFADCVASLEFRELLQQFSVRYFPNDAEHAALTQEWERRKREAQCALTVAATDGEVRWDDAYLVGLLYDEGAIASALGWNLDAAQQDSPGQLLAVEGSLPAAAASAFVADPDYPAASIWRSLLERAHALAQIQNSKPPRASHSLLIDSSCSGTA